MKGMVSFCITLFALYTLSSRSSNVVAARILPSSDPDAGPSADFPSPLPPAPVESPESDFGLPEGDFDVNQYGGITDGETEYIYLILKHLPPIQET